MEPTERPARHTRMRSLALPVAALLLPLTLVGCSDDDDGDDVASDPAPTSATASPTSSPTSSPTAEPTVGTYPAFEPEDYTYELEVSCFCPDAGNPVQVTVEGGAVVEPAEGRFRLTINDVIDAANDTEADRVAVDWPAGQDYPNSVYVDAHKEMADEEIGYTITNVVVAGGQ